MTKTEAVIYVPDISIVLLAFSYHLEFPGTVMCFFLCIGKNSNILNNL